MSKLRTDLDQSCDFELIEMRLQANNFVEAIEGGWEN